MGAMGGGGTQKESSTQTVSPWAPMAPYLTDIMTKAQNLYNQGPPQMYSGQYLPDLSAQTQNAIAGITNLTQSGVPQALYNTAENTASSIAQGQGTGGGNAWLQQFLGQGTNNPAWIYALQHGDPNSAERTAQRMLTQTASGANVGANPYLNAMYAQASQPIVSQFENQIAPGISAQFSAAGRYGRHPGGALDTTQGAAETALGNALGNAATGIYSNAYNTDRAQQQAAQQQLASLGLGMQQIGNQTGTLLGQLQGQGISAAQALNTGQTQAGQLALQGAQTIPGLVNASYQPYQMESSAGSLLDQFNQQNQLYQEQLYNYMNGGGDWQNLKNYAGLIYSNPGAQYTTTQKDSTKTAPSVSPFSQILSLGGALGSAVAGFPAFGAGLGAIGSFFGGGGGGWGSSGGASYPGGSSAIFA